MTVTYNEINKMLIAYNAKKSNYKFIIDWSPKSGCTTICKMIFDYMDELEKALKFDKWIHNSRDKYYQKYGRVNTNILLNNEFIKIKFVRNPYSRVVSSYLHVMKNDKFRKIFVNKDMSFYTFLLNIEKQNYPSNPHYNLQMLRSEKINTFDHIIKIEDLDNGIKNLNKLYNLNLNHSFTSRHHIIKHDVNINVGYTKYSNILKIPHYKYFYDDEKIKDLVEKIYKQDIITYNYTYNDF